MMSDTDGSLYGGDSMDELITTTSLVKKAITNNFHMSDPMTPKKACDAFLDQPHQVCATSTPIMDSFLMSKPRSLSLTNLTAISEFDEKNVNKENEWFNAMDADQTSRQEAMDDKAIIQRLRLERTMPEYECNSFAAEGQRFLRQEAARKIQQCMIVHSYRKVKQQADELKDKLEVVHKLHETTMLKLKASKAEADIERAKAMSHRRDLAAALNQLDEQERISDTLNKEVAKLRDQSMNLQAQCHKLDETVHFRDNELTELQTELNKQKEQLSKAETALVERDLVAQAMAAKMSELEQKMEELMKRVEASEEQNHAYAAEMAKKEEELDMASMTIQELNEEKDELEGVLKMVKDEMDEIRVDLSRQMITEEELAKTVDVLTKAMAEYAESNHRLEGNLKDTRAENFNLKKRIIEQHMLQEQARVENNKTSIIYRGAVGMTGFVVKALIVAFMPYQTSFIVHDI